MLSQSVQSVCSPAWCLYVLNVILSASIAAPQRLARYITLGCSLTLHTLELLVNAIGLIVIDSQSHSLQRLMTQDTIHCIDITVLRS